MREVCGWCGWWVVGGGVCVYVCVWVGGCGWGGWGGAHCTRAAIGRLRALSQVALSQATLSQVYQREPGVQVGPGQSAPSPLCAPSPAPAATFPKLSVGAPARIRASGPLLMLSPSEKPGEERSAPGLSAGGGPWTQAGRTAPHAAGGRAGQQVVRPGS